MTITDRASRRSRPPRADIASVMLRILPRRSPLHRTWAGTKVIALTVLTIPGVMFPTWTTLGILLAVTLAGFAAARATPAAVPRLPRTVWALLAVTGVLAWIGGGLAAFLISLGLTATLTFLAVVITWTTPLAELAPALAVLWSPLRRIGVPVNEWSLTTALAARAVPLFFEEVRVLLAARRLRGGNRVSGIRSARDALVDVLTAVLAAAQRRANDFGRTMTLRGGVPKATIQRPRLSAADALVLTAAIAGATAIIVLGVTQL
ncbi:CbiQ family ECF transporter T component [Leifsonia sp. L25]|uniref:CbiQ family ECF transporter T component n=1 Tax=Actinomycetes TaxID=1760 RepID=UPI003D69163D